MRVLIETLGTIWQYLVIAIVCTLTFIVQLVVFPIEYAAYLIKTGRKGKGCPFWYSGRVFRMSSVISIKLNFLWSFKCYSKLPDEMPTGKVGRSSANNCYFQRRFTVLQIFVSNHLSFVDAALLSFLPWEMKWLAKRSIFWYPIIGWMMWLAGDISVKRGNRDSAREAMAGCADRLDRGCNVMIFPEVCNLLYERVNVQGTRSKTGVMGEFKDGAFRLAIEKQVDIIPLAVVGTYDCLPPGGLKLSYAKGLFSVGKPISVKGKTLSDLELLKNETRKRIQEMVEEMKPHSKVD